MECGSFNLLVFSTFDGLGREAAVFFIVALLTYF